MVMNLSEASQPKREKARFNLRLGAEGQDYLGFIVWPAKNEPNAEVIAVDVRRLEGDVWKTLGRLAIYRTADGQYKKLPDRERPPA
jgi:hypothetical protein